MNVSMLGEARFATTRRISGAERTMQQITRKDPPHGWAARGIDGPIRPNATITGQPVNGGTRSRVTFTLDFEGHGIGVPLLLLVRGQAHKDAHIRNGPYRIEGSGLDARCEVPIAVSARHCRACSYDLV